MKITIASDSFKGSLSSIEVAGAAEKGILKAIPDAEIVKINVADGGEGLTEALIDSLGGEMVEVNVSDPLGRKIAAKYGISVDEHGTKTAVIEMAAASGLPILSESERNPMETSTFGTGEMILDALDRGCRKFLIGIGGSATNDAGMGMLRALGWKFLNRMGKTLEGKGKDLTTLYAIDGSNADVRLKEAEFTVACDVTNPFCGPKGAAYVFAPQKGADEQMVQTLDEGLKNFAAIVNAKYGKKIADMAGAGAAGGLGGAFKAFLNTTLRSGIDMVLDTIDFDGKAIGSDLIITGEGKVDSQTPGGKTAAGVLRRAHQMGIPCVVIGGKVSMCPELENAGFAGIFPITDGPCTLEQAMDSDIAFNNVSRTAREIVSLIKAYE